MSQKTGTHCENHGKSRLWLKINTTGPDLKKSAIWPQFQKIYDQSVLWVKKVDSDKSPKINKISFTDIRQNLLICIKNEKNLLKTEFPLFSINFGKSARKKFKRFSMDGDETFQLEFYNFLRQILFRIFIKKSVK